MLRREAWKKSTKVSEVLTASIISYFVVYLTTLSVAQTT
jgi:hypothetical protein